MKKIFSILIMLIFGVSAYALSIGQRADSAYNAENYRLAIDLYQKSLAEEGARATCITILAMRTIAVTSSVWRLCVTSARCALTRPTTMPAAISSL